jgi:hypothetical protein
MNHDIHNQIEYYENIMELYIDRDEGICRGLPKISRYADDRAPIIEEIQKICEYPDRRIKAIVYVMSSSGIRLGTWIIYAGSGKCSVTSLYK